MSQKANYIKNIKLWFFFAERATNVSPDSENSLGFLLYKSFKNSIIRGLMVDGKEIANSGIEIIGWNRVCIM